MCYRTYIHKAPKFYELRHSQNIHAPSIKKYSILNRGKRQNLIEKLVHVEKKIANDIEKTFIILLHKNERTEKNQKL